MATSISSILRGIRPMTFLLPGLFLFVLGIGNIWVGSYKGAEYDQVVQELSERSTPQNFGSKISPIERIRLSKQSSDRLADRRKKALGRKHFYTLVSIGGKIFIAGSLFLLGSSAFLYSLKRKLDRT